MLYHGHVHQSIKISVCTLIQGQIFYFPILPGLRFTNMEPRAVVGNYQFQQHDLQPILKHIVFSELSLLIQNLSTKLDSLISNHDIIWKHDFLSIVFQTMTVTTMVFAMQLHQTLQSYKP